MFVLVNEEGKFWSASLYGEYGEGWSATTADILRENEIDAALEAATEAFEPGKIWVKELIFKN